MTCDLCSWPHHCCILVHKHTWPRLSDITGDTATSLSYWYCNCSLACRTLISIHVADLTEHLVVAHWQSQACTTLQAVQTFASWLLQHHLPANNLTTINFTPPCTKFSSCLVSGCSRGKYLGAMSPRNRRTKWRAPKTQESRRKKRQVGWGIGRRNPLLHPTRGSGGAS